MRRDRCIKTLKSFKKRNSNRISNSTARNVSMQVKENFKFKIEIFP